MRRVPNFLFVFGLFVFLAATAGAEVSQEQEALSAKYREVVGKVKEDYSAQEGELFDRYADAVERLQTGFQNNGDLENALLAKKEVALARQDRTPGKELFPRIEPLRQTVIQQSERMRMAEARDLVALMEKFEGALQPLKEKLTREGSLEAAVEIDRLLKKLKTDRIETERIAQAGDPGMTREAPPRISNSILGTAKPVTGKHRLTRGLYEKIGRTTLGDRETDDPIGDEAEVLMPPGSEFRKGEIFLDVAKVNAQECRFSEINFSQNLHSEFSASGCLFDECTFAKGGAWGAKVSSKWILTDCVFHGDMFKEWRSRLTGVKANQCTFEKIEFEPWGYEEDGGVEAADPWWVLERCVFRDCAVPVSVLLATRNCVFENSRIERDRFPMETRISVIIYYRGLQPEIPDMGEMITIQAKPVEKLGGKVGAQVNYRLSRDGLVFED